MYKDMKTKLKDCWDQFKKYRSRRDADGILRYNTIRWEYLRLLEKQEIFWKQRAKQFWLQEGDKNS